MHISVKPRIAVVTPFLDKRHGTERCVAEQVERLAGEFELHLYSARIKDMNLKGIVWHRVPALPGPHLSGYIWWFVANYVQRWWDARFRGLKYDLVYTPGINCLDADVISVHIVFSEFCRRMREDLTLGRNPLGAWPRLLHRRIYYGLIRMLERWVYTREDLPLLVVSQKVADDLGRHYGKKGHLSVLYHGWDPSHFGCERRASLRRGARYSVGLSDKDFAVLLIGNDWKKKGLPCLVEAVGRLQNPDLRILIVGSDATAPYASLIRRAGLQERVLFLPIRKDVEFYYAAADAYVGPSLEDAFAMPPLEAMACGLPVIVSRQAGVSEIITHKVDGLVLEDSGDSEMLAAMIANVCGDPDLRQSLGERAVRTAKKYTWDRNAEQLRELFDNLIQSRRNEMRRSEPVAC